MPRHRRIEIAGAIYHVITRGIERREIFKDDKDREEFVRRFGEALKTTGSKCLGWVLMPNHLHLLIRAGVKPLSDVMRKLLTGYAVYFNHRHKRSGYLYQNRYKSVLCEEEAYLLELVRYIHLNPLRAKIVKDISELIQYKWSGHSVIMGKQNVHWQSIDEVLERFGSQRKEAIGKYESFIEDGEKMGKRDDLTGGGLRRSAGGWQGVLALKRSKDYWRGDERILGDGDFVNEVLKQSEEEIASKDRLKREGWDIEKLKKKISDIMSVKTEDLMKKGRNDKISRAKKVIAYLGNKELGISGVELARHFKITKQAISKAMKAGEEIAKEENVKLSS
jgi:REP element-mobilizing transposase RayT